MTAQEAIERARQALRPLEAEPCGCEPEKHAVALALIQAQIEALQSLPDAESYLYQELNVLQSALAELERSGR